MTLRSRRRKRISGGSAAAAHDPALHHSVEAHALLSKAKSRKKYNAEVAFPVLLSNWSGALRSSPTVVEPGRPQDSGTIFVPVTACSAVSHGASHVGPRPFRRCC